MMRDDVRGELSLGEFAQSVNLSVWRLCHIFKSDVGMPPIRYLRLLRMERAKDLLESSFLSVKEIAFQVGLNDESHFVQRFQIHLWILACPLPNTVQKQQRREPGPSNGNGNQAGKVKQQLSHAAKQSILPTLHLFIYMFSFFSLQF